jgi:hypothetical protein
MSNHLNEKATNEPQFKIGVNGNYYVYCKSRDPLVDVAKKIGKSESGIYYNEKYEVWAIRVKLKSHKNNLKNLFKNSLHMS